MAKYSQGERLMQITTPFEDDFLLINELTVNEGVSQLFEYEVELLHEESKPWPHRDEVDPAKILGQMVSIKITQVDEGGRMFNGFVNRFSQGDRGRLFSRYRISVVPDFWMLTQNRQSFIFQQKTVPAILTDVFKRYDGLENKVTLDFEYEYKPRNYCVQYRETDFDFISRLMEEEGIYYYFEHLEDGNHRTIISDKPRFSRNCPNKSEISFEDVAGKEDFESVILKWKTDYNIATGLVTYHDHHIQLPKNELEAVKSTAFSFGVNSSWEVYEYSGGYARKYDGIDPAGNERNDDLKNVLPDGKHGAETAMQVIDARHQLGKAKSDCSSITAGHKFKLKNHAIKDLNGEFVVIEASHQAYQWPPYQTQGDDETGAPEGVEEYVNFFTALAHGRTGARPFRPELKTPKPMIYGSQTAIVVGSGDEEIFTDKYGRIKVHFNWDRQGKADGVDSCWLPVAQPWAGKQWGSVFIPRVGMEVVVHFVDGNPDQPMVTGCVYNPLHMPPYELPKYKTMSTIKSDSSKGHKGFNELRFEDKKSKEQVFIHSQKRYDLRARGSMYETCGGSRSEVVGLKDPENPGGNLTVTVAGCHDFHVKEAEYIGIDQKRNETVKGEVVEDYESSQFTKVATKRSLNAQEIIMEAATKISLKVGASCIVIEPALITIAAAMVKINSGGFGTETGDPGIDDPTDAEVADNGEPGNLDRPRGGGGGGRRHRTLNSQHHVYPPRPGESAAFTAMRNRLNTSAQGRHALEVFERNGVQVTNNPGGTAYSGNPTNSVNLDPARAGDQAPGFVHEMGHAEADHGGTSADVQAQTRAAYIDTQLREDAANERRAYESEEQMNAAGGTERYNSSTRTTYQNARNAERTRLRAAEPGISDEDLNRRSNDAAEAAILQDYRNGNVNTGNTTPPQSYVNYWGSDYDARHRP